MTRSLARFRWMQRLALLGMMLGLVLLADHVRRHVVEAELALPALLLLTGGGAAEAIARDALLLPRTLAPLVAIVGCDGAGKSTLSADMWRSFGAERPVALAYLGLGSGELGARIKRWPVIGAAVERRLARKARQTRDRRGRIPGLPTALVIYAFSLLRARRFRRMLALRSRGVAVITDRYPQEEVPGFYDGPGLSAARAGSRAVARLAARERRLYQWMAGFTPDIVLRLNVDAATALARKPDHQPQLLAAKVAATPLLRFQGARIVEIDAAADYDQVRRQAFAAAAPVLRRSGAADAASRLTPLGQEVPA